MPQSLSAMYAHLVFSTKHRVPGIQPDWSPRLYEYLGGILARRRGALLAAGGMPDHVHLLASIGREWSLADLLRDLKAGSSKWIHETLPGQRAFEWQSGYAAFSVSPSNLDAVKRYIADQPTHHQARTFQDELRALLERHGLTWDERYVWD
jgi:putative transposase